MDGFVFLAAEEEAVEPRCEVFPTPKCSHALVASFPEAGLLRRA
jgi:hypothetical protein